MTSFWTEEKIATAERLWAEGVSAKEIADIVGSRKNTVINMAGRHRDRFPSRQPRREKLGVDAAPAAPIHHPDRVKRVTIAGAEVTLPRVPSIDGHFVEGR